MTAILDFHLRGWNLCWNYDSIMFSVFQNMGLHTTIVYLTFAHHNCLSKTNVKKFTWF